MPGLARKRCLNHETREAVCRCPSCQVFFCRECTVLFESRLLCAACLARNSAATAVGSKARFGLGGLALACLGLLIAWVLFYFSGWTILQFRERSPRLAVLNVSGHDVTLQGTR